VAFWVAPNMEFFEYSRRTGRRSPTFRITPAWTMATASGSGGCWMS
jgi:hypothetical protein